MSRRPLPKGVIILLAVAFAIMLASVVAHFVRPESQRARLQTLRTELQFLRSASDSCRAALADEEAAFRAYNDSLDAMRQRITELEALDPRGVPADSYAAYLETFHSYNEGIPGWGTAVENLEAHWQDCRELIGRHNRLADSARELADELDLLRDEQVNDG
jgi:hypothetical protein